MPGRTKTIRASSLSRRPASRTRLRTGVMRNTNLSVRGGGENYNFYLSGEKNDEDGTFINNFNNRIGGRANFGFVPSPKANFNVNVGYTQLDQQTPLSDNASNSIVRNSYRGEAGGLRGQYLPGFKNYMPEFSNKYLAARGAGAAHHGRDRAVQPVRLVAEQADLRSRQP